MNENRTVFAFGGITGAIVAVIGLLATLIILNVYGLFSQQENANNYYKIGNAEKLTTVNTGKTSEDFIVDVPAPK
jgi:hypothetical protein